MHRVAFIGLGYVGLTTAVCFASKGIDVVGYDVDRNKVQKLKDGRLPIYEPGLQELFRSSKNLKFTEDPAEAIESSDVVFITVGTPSNDYGSIDLSYVKDASSTIGRYLKEYKVVVVKSTVVPGTTSGLVRREIEASSGRKCCEDFGLVMNPEFLREGMAVYDTFHPDRIIIGEMDARSGDVLLELYRNFYQELPPVIRTTPENAELIKYANNAFLALKVTFANMMARLCMEIPGADVDVVMKGIGLDKRIGPDFLYAGMAWGGSCFPKDLKALVSFAREKGINLDLIESALEINRRGPVEVADILEKELNGLEGKVVAVLGVAFKPNTDDTRESPAVYLMEELIKRKAQVVACDPAATMKNLIVKRSVNECLEKADAAVLVTEWDDYKKLRPKEFLKLKHKLVIDTRRVYDPKDFRKMGIRLIQLGRNS